MVYKLYNIEMEKIEISRDVIFNEIKFIGVKDLCLKYESKENFNVNDIYNYDILEEEFFLWFI